MGRLLAALLLVGLLLCGCGGEESLLSDAIDFRASLVQAQGCSFTAEVTADFGDRVQSFSLACNADGEGNVDLTLLAPETITGVTASVTKEGGKITYDGMSVDFGLLAGDRLIPASAPAMVLSAWMKDYIHAACVEEDIYRVTYQKDFQEDSLLIDTFFEKGIPFCAELCYNGQRILKMDISDFTMH